MHPADFYTGIVPEIYNVLRGTHFDVERYRAFIEEHGTPALELGCGDSGPFYRLAALGLDLEGVDSSEDMVRRGRERLAADGLDTPIHHQRMEDLALGRTFPSVYLAGPTFNLLPDDATALAALRAIARHLSPDGAALVPLWVPGPTPAEQIGVPREARAGDSDARYTVTGEDYDPDNRTRTTTVRYELVTGAQSVVDDRDWIIHWFTPEVFRGLAEQAGLEAELTDVEENETEAILRPRSAPTSANAGR